MIRYSGPLNMTWGAGTLVFNNTSEPLAGITADGGSILNTYAIDTSGNIVSSTLQNNGTWLKGKISSLGSPNSDLEYRATNFNTEFYCMVPKQCNSGSNSRSFCFKQSS